MELMKLQHTDPSKSTIEMDKDKYELLKKLVIKILRKKPESNFEQLLADVSQELADTDTMVKGSMQWNLGWVSMDMEAKHELFRDGTVEPPLYSLKR
jgi:predicted metal-dependent hydrolase